MAFDLPEPTFRHKQYDEYKAGRTKAPDILRQQLGLVRQIVEALAMPIVEQSGYEADDVICKDDKRFDVYLDKDFKVTKKVKED